MSAKSPRGAGGGANVVLRGRNGATERTLALHLVYIYSQRQQGEAAAVHTGDLKSFHTELKETWRQNKKCLRRKMKMLKERKIQDTTGSFLLICLGSYSRRKWYFKWQKLGFFKKHFSGFFFQTLLTVYLYSDDKWSISNTLSAHMLPVALLKRQVPETVTAVAITTATYRFCMFAFHCYD